ncbi:LytR/AlgR family response regulator transcription factor [Candidatus Formimonas warabiya]|uniref:Stage 0 sporulation protein A homolog n=1 Tax=Formimonas warabiya TaxID=1761012 RepID=A0A3G1KT02_FORW1|nr:response regulator [Candidatus Formimonas warabiya]ATW25612.1 hypothetical protein DCMF_13345 [Candidatus Formimonas warabiya]
MGEEGGAGIRILILDTEQPTLKKMQSYLQELDYISYTEVYTQSEMMLDAYRRERPGMVFIRVGRPDLNGLSAARRIRAMDELAKIVFICKNQDYTTLAWELRAVDYLLDPLDYDRFIEVLARAG